MLKKLISSLFVSILVVVLGYAFFVFFSRVPNFEAAQSFAQLKTFPSMVCDFSTDGFTEAMKGTIYINEGVMRSDYMYFSGRDEVRIHMIIGTDGIGRAWKDGSSEGVLMDLGSATPSPTAPAFESFRTYENIDCKRWWFVDKSLFVIPTDINFSPPDF